MADTPKKKRDASRWLKGRTFRLSDETMAEMERVAADLTRSTGAPHTLTDVIRVLVHRESERIKKREEK